MGDIADAPAEDVWPVVNGKEALAARHKEELKELRNRIQALKKTATKGDKKKKKEVAAAIAVMESEMDSRHEKELAEVETESHQDVADVTAEAATDSSNPIAVQDAAAELGELSIADSGPETGARKVSRQHQRKVCWKDR
jgi:OTU domain-containing protein 6